MVAIPLTNLAKSYSLENSYYYISQITGLGNNQAVFFYKTPDGTETGLLVFNNEQNTFEDLSKIYPAALKNNQLRPMVLKTDTL